MNILLLNSYVGVVFSTKKGNKSIIEISIKCSSPSLGIMIDTQESSLYFICIKYPCSVTLGYRCHHCRLGPTSANYEDRHTGFC